MIGHILAKLYKLILENKISLWLEIHGKSAKGQVEHMRYHSILDHLVTLRIIAEEYHNNKIDMFYCFFYFRKTFDIIPKTKLWKRLEEIMVLLEFRVVVRRLYKNVISKI